MTNNTRNSIIYENNNKCSMLNNRSTARIVPSWDMCIEALFDSHLPMKFAFTGRLSLHDITQDGFYVLRRNVCTYDILRIYGYFYFLIFFLISFDFYQISYIGRYPSIQILSPGTYLCSQLQ